MTDGLTKAQKDAIASFTPEQHEMLNTLLALPANVAMAVVATTLGVNGKRFRQWLRTVRKVGVSGHAAGCERQAPNADDYIAAVARYVKA